MDTPRSNTPFAAGNSGADAMLNKAAIGAHGVVDKIVPAVDHVAELAHQAVNKAADVASPTVDWLARQSESLIAGKRKAVAEANEYVTAHPWKSIGVTLLAGWLIGRFVR